MLIYKALQSYPSNHYLYPRVTVLFLVLSFKGIKAQLLPLLNIKELEYTANEYTSFSIVALIRLLTGTSTYFNLCTISANNSMSVIFMDYKPQTEYVITGKS